MSLDSRERIHQIDKSGMLDILGTFPHQMEEGLRIGNKIPGYRGDITKVVIVGVGGSAFTGDVIQAYGKHNSSVPIFVTSAYHKVLMVSLLYNSPILLKH